VGELNGSNAPDSVNTNNEIVNDASESGSGGSGSGVSFGENQIRTFETDASEYMSRDADDADDADDDDGSGRLNIGGDIKLDTLDIHTLNDTQNINVPPLLDDIEVLA
jgi:hypothetical protein